LQVLVRTRNLELRRLLLDRIGYERFLEIAGATLVAQDDFGSSGAPNSRSTAIRSTWSRSLTRRLSLTARIAAISCECRPPRPPRAPRGRPSRGRSGSTTPASTWSRRKVDVTQLRWVSVVARQRSDTQLGAAS